MSVEHSARRIASWQRLRAALRKHNADENILPVALLLEQTMEILPPHMDLRDGFSCRACPMLGAWIAYADALGCELSGSATQVGLLLATSAMSARRARAELEELGYIGVRARVLSFKGSKGSWRHRDIAVALSARPQLRSAIVSVVAPEPFYPAGASAGMTEVVKPPHVVAGDFVDPGEVRAHMRNWRSGLDDGHKVESP